MFGAKPKWTRNLQIWGEARVVTVGMDSKTSNKGARMMFVRYGERKHHSIRMWDPSTMRVEVTWDVIWLKHINYQPNDV